MISRALYDWWKIQPPCESEEGTCHGACPYYSECYSDYDDEDDEDEDYAQHFDND